jgi:hypothetical protein
MASAIGGIAGSLISGVSSYYGNKTAASIASANAAASAAWRGQVTNAAQPWKTTSESSYNLLGQALGTQGASGVQSYLANYVTPLMSGVESNATKQLSQKYAAMGYGPVSGNASKEIASYLSQLELNQYNTGVQNLQNAASSSGSLAASMYGTAGQSLSSQTSSSNTAAQYSGQSVAGLGSGVSSAVSSLSNYLNSQPKTTTQTQSLA